MKKNENLPKKISVFPLSNFIIFPNTSVPLNIFEPRYIKMIDDNMKNDHIIGMIQPKKQKKIFQNYIPSGVLEKLQALTKVTMEDT